MSDNSIVIRNATIVDGSGKDPFDGKKSDEKGLPAGGVDKRGSTVLPEAKSKKTKQEETEF